MRNRKIREIVFYKDYFLDFLKSQKQKVKDKILWTLKIIETLEHIPSDYFEHIAGTEGLYEVRIKHGSDIFRIFCFFHKGRLVILINGFQKKTQKTPRAEIEKALRIKKEYESHEY